MVVNDAEPLDGLTPIQLEIIHAIRKLKRDKGYPPCVREVLEAVSLSSPGPCLTSTGN